MVNSLLFKRFIVTSKNYYNDKKIRILVFGIVEPKAVISLFDKSGLSKTIKYMYLNKHRFLTRLSSTDPVKETKSVNMSDCILCFYIYD